MPADRNYHIRPVLDGQTLAGALRILITGMSWGDARRLIHNRHVQVNGNLVLDDARRLKSGDVVKVSDHARAPVPTERDVRVVHVDADLIVVDKPAGITTLRHAAEEGWDDARKQRQPTLDEVVQEMLPRVMRDVPPPAMPKKGPPVPDAPPGVYRRTNRPTPRPPGAVPKLRPVHRLDRDTSGLMMFALTPRAEQKLVGMFKEHTITRLYRAVVLGGVTEPMRVESWFVRDRGDGVRGSSPAGKAAAESQHAVTHVRPIRPIAGGTYTLVECQLESGRTHQIRIHLAEAGHMLCGERTYVRPAVGAPAVKDESEAPRQALHSAECRFTHPVTGDAMAFTSPMAKDLAQWIERLG